LSGRRTCSRNQASPGTQRFGQYRNLQKLLDIHSCPELKALRTEDESSHRHNNSHSNNPRSKNLAHPNLQNLWFLLRINRRRRRRARRLPRPEAIEYRHICKMPSNTFYNIGQLLLCVSAGKPNDIYKLYPPPSTIQCRHADTLASVAWSRLRRHFLKDER
jgi:hypothetical protein